MLLDQALIVETLIYKNNYSDSSLKKRVIQPDDIII